MITLHGCVTMLALALQGAPEADGPGRRPAPPRTAPAKAAPAKAAPAEASPAKAAPLAPAATAEELEARIQRFYADLRDYSADFIQVYRRVALGKTSESRGKLQIKKPGLMRWAYEKPQEKLWLVDGQRLWVTDPDQQQVYVDDQVRTTELTAAIGFLWGKGRLGESFTARLVDPAAHDLPAAVAALELVPRKGATYARLVLGVDRVTGEVTESVVFETAGNTNRFRFRDVKTNTGLPDTLFTFTPPPGWDVVHR